MLRRALTAAVPWLPAFRFSMARGQWRALAPAVRAIGWPAALRLCFAMWCQRESTGARGRLRPSGFNRPLHFRCGTSDPHVVEQVFVRREYAAVAELPGVEFVVDCGANIGLTTFYLLHKYPNARAAVVEPDAGNMALCRKNLAPFGDRVTFVEAGVWSAAGPLVVERTAADGAAWAFHVRPARAGEAADVNAVTIPDVLARAGFPRVDLLKIDIEGAETEVLSAGATEWLALTRNVAIELHGPECEAALERALAGFTCERGTSGELTILTGLAPRSVP